MFATSPLSPLTAPRSGGYFAFSDVQAFVSHHAEILLLLACLVGYLCYQNREQQMAAAIIEQPRQSDFLYADYFALNSESDARHRFVPMKVLEVTELGVRLKVGNIAHSTPVSPREHAKFDNALTVRNYYRQEELFLRHAQLQQLYQTGVIYTARRPRSIFIDGWIVIPKSEMYLEPGAR